MNKLGIFVA